MLNCKRLSVSDGAPVLFAELFNVEEVIDLPQSNFDRNYAQRLRSKLVNNRVGVKEVYVTSLVTAEGKSVWRIVVGEHR